MSQGSLGPRMHWDALVSKWDCMHLPFTGRVLLPHWLSFLICTMGIPTPTWGSVCV